MAFGDQLEGTLQLIAGSLRAGYGLMQAVNTVAAEAPSPTAEEFDRVVMETRLGRDLIDSLEALSGRVANEDFGWIVQAIRIQREVGGDLSELLDTITSTIRDRHQVHRQVQALSAEGRLSALILILLPIGLAGVILITTPDYLTVLVNTTIGRILIAVGVVLMVTGAVWIRRIVRLTF
jgi:tight adherence protein B